MKQNILKQLKSDYEKLEIKPSADLWNRIDQMEQEDEKVPVMIPKRSFQWWKYAAVLVLLFSVGALLYFNQEKPAGKIDLITNTKPIGHHIQTKTHDIDIESTQINPVAENEMPKEKEEKRNATKVINNTETHQPEVLFENGSMVLNKDEKIIVSNSEIKAPVLDGNINPILDKTSLTEQKKAEYIHADELLQGREFQKKREEHRTDVRKFGSLDITKIKIKGPSSLKIFGVTVYSDSLESK
ncbi:hypothetical protein F3J23_06085 [Chryseobacterium sp. Tr-659]|uniref:hypothetical protein n=1 Tax=Chryseobacterium sp. Tr-659 TaxID=2608340 RepID=UPI001422D108|nr:hypothetical protein [Chryseobacterium sp. Tr-659]NIF05007.1 hypothetical protein [Chryseobacterium sp. Tr-659]